MSEVKLAAGDRVVARGAMVSAPDSYGLCVVYWDGGGRTDMHASDLTPDAALAAAEAAPPSDQRLHDAILWKQGWEAGMADAAENASVAAIPEYLEAALRNLDAAIKTNDRTEVYAAVWETRSAADRAGILTPPTPKATAQDVLDAVREVARRAPEITAAAGPEAPPGTISHLLHVAILAGEVKLP